MPESPTGQADLFSKLAAQYGINAALALLPLFSADATTKQKAFSGASLAGTGAKAAGTASGVPSLAKVGSGIGTGLGLASAGYGVYNAATNPDFNKAQQVGHSGRAVSDAIMSLVIPYYGLARGASAGGQLMERSSSPQVRGAGRAIGQVAEPSGARAFWDVVQGDRSPGAAFKAHGGLEGLMFDTMGPVGAVLKGIGVNLPFLHSEPTTGTKFRGELEQIFSRIEPLKGTSTAKYNAPTGGYEAFTPEAYSAATSLGKLLAPYAKDAAKDPEAYSLQAANILLNTHGNNLPTLMPSILQLLQTK